MGPVSETSERQQYLAFALAGGDYAVGILKVKEILQYEDITAVPSTPRSVRGVLNLRGSVVPVVDLALKLGLPTTAVTNRTCIVVVETSLGGVAAVVGLLVDGVSEVVELGPEDVEEPPAFGTGASVEYLLGMGKVGRKFALLLDIDRVLAAAEGDLATPPEHETLATSEEEESPAAPGAQEDASAAPA